MKKSILELANELDVTKQAIQYQIKKIDDQYLSKRSDGAYLISVEGQNLIREYMGFEMKDSTKRSGKDLLDDTIVILKKELEEKNDQIEKLQELLTEQQNLLSQQQQLSLQSNQQIQHLQLELSKEPNEENNNKAGDVSGKNQSNKKKGFFSRLFNK